MEVKVGLSVLLLVAACAFAGIPSAQAKREFTIEEVVKHLNLTSTPNGNFIRELFTSKLVIKKDALPSTFHGDRPASNTIYNLFPAGVTIKFHKMAADETIHWYMGQPTRVVELSDAGKISITEVGPELDLGQVPQYTVPAGTWMGLAVKTQYRNQYSLTGATVAPAWDISDVIIPTRAELLKLCTTQECKDWVYALTDK